MNITKELYGQDLTSPDFKLYIVDDGFQVNDKDIVKTARVGIDYAEEYKDVLGATISRIIPLLVGSSIIPI